MPTKSGKGKSIKEQMGKLWNSHAKDIQLIIERSVLTSERHSLSVLHQTRHCSETAGTLFPAWKHGPLATFSKYCFSQGGPLKLVLAREKIQKFYFGYFVSICFGRPLFLMTSCIIHMAKKD